MKNFKHAYDFESYFTYEIKYYKISGIKNDTATTVLETFELEECEEINTSETSFIILEHRTDVKAYSSEVFETFTILTTDGKKVCSTFNNDRIDYFVKDLIEKMEFNNLHFFESNKKNTNTEFTNKEDNTMSDKINNLINELNTMLNWREINTSLLEDLYYKYSVMSGSLFVEMTGLLEDIIEHEVGLYEMNVYGVKTTCDIYDMLKDIRFSQVDISCFEDEINKLISKCERELALIDEEVSCNDTSKKQVILINSSEDCIKVSRSKHSKSLKNRFIVERNFNPEEPGRKSFILGYYSDYYEITIFPATEMKDEYKEKGCFSRSEESQVWEHTGKYELCIYRKDTQYCKSSALDKADVIEYESNLLWAELTEAHTVATYSCYAKAREALFELVKEYENCDIYAYMRYPATGRTFNTTNSNLIKKNDLHKIV